MGIRRDFVKQNAPVSIINTTDEPPGGRQVNNPFLITGPTILGNSGGGTSGMNLFLHLEANGGTLTDNGRCVMTNTGWENPLTFEFLAEQERRWGCEIYVLEFEWRKATPAELTKAAAKSKAAADRYDRLTKEPVTFFAAKPRKCGGGTLFDNAPTPDQRQVEALRKASQYERDCEFSLRRAEKVGMPSYRRVTWDTVSMDGRPFNDLLEGLYLFRTEIKGEPPILPNGAQRLCTGRLKMRTSCQFARDTWGCGPSGYECRLGLRADEVERVASAFKTKSHEAGRPVFPLDTAGIEKADVKAFWDKQPFRLQLRAHEGNCGGCYMKRPHALVDLIRRQFFDLEWWKGWEAKTGQKFRTTRNYRGIETMARTQLELIPPDDFDNAVDCESGYCSN